MDFSSAAGELYGVTPDEFVAVRTRLSRRARDEGDAALAKRLGALRRPTLPAWAVNQLARSAADDLGRLLDVGEEIRAAWGSGGLGDLERRRAGLVRDLVRTAGELASAAGRPLRDQAVREVEDTLQAATVDPDVADEVREGRLAQPRSHSGFGPVGFPMPAEGAARPRKAPAKEKRAGTRRKQAEAEKPKPKPKPEPKPSAARVRRAETLRRRADEAEAALAGHRERAAEARAAAGSAADEVGRLRHELERAVADRDAAEHRAERAERALSRAEDAAREARAAADAADAATGGRGQPGRPAGSRPR
ncbi:hypothetical protein [Actinomadura litoris]|uniref:hypothetical protein n=1 Tax=Actinomadura litoris TaxID=2678616 RepID=UPI002342EB8D|nr:hypothetical protein [Actinomadura litoris]